MPEARYGIFHILAFACAGHPRIFSPLSAQIAAGSIMLMAHALGFRISGAYESNIFMLDALNLRLPEIVLSNHMSELV